MKSAQNETDNCTSCANSGNAAKNRAANSVMNSVGNHGNLKEIKNQGDMRDVTDYNGDKNRINMTNS